MDAQTRALVRYVKSNPAELQALLRELLPEVHLVVGGEYSDYHEVAVFSDRGEAERWVAWSQEHLRAEDRDYTADLLAVHTMQLNQVMEEGPGAWCVLYVVRECAEMGGRSYARWDGEQNARQQPHLVLRPSGDYGATHARRCGWMVSCTGYGKTEEHARRSAQERGRVFLATHSFVMIDGLERLVCEAGCEMHEQAGVVPQHGQPDVSPARLAQILAAP